ncbi:MAG: C-GCAxxG-C-C family protein [bacterium]
MVTPVVLPASPAWIERVKEKALTNMKQHGSCTQSILAAFMEELGLRDGLVLRAAGALHGGMLYSLTCGVHAGAAMVLGLLIGRERLEQGMDGLFPITGPAQELVKRLNRRLGSSSCRELTGVDFADLEAAFRFYASKDHEKCFERVVQGTEETALLLKELGEQGQLFRTE